MNVFQRHTLWDLLKCLLTICGSLILIVILFVFGTLYAIVRFPFFLIRIMSPKRPAPQKKKVARSHWPR